MTEPTFKVARIVYLPDLTRADAGAIPLGVFAEMLTERSRGLGLKARKGLTQGELVQIAPILRDALADPFEYFRSQFNEAWDKAEPGKALDYLGRRHSSNLSVLAAEDCPAERNWLGLRLLPPRNDALEAKLIAALDAEYDGLWEDGGANEDSEKLFIERQNEARAA